MSEWLGKDVRELPTSFDKLDDDLPSINTVPEEVELSRRCVYSGRAEPDSSRGRWQAGCPPSVLVGELPRRLAHPAAGVATQLGTPLCRRYVLCLTRRQRHHLLFQR